MLFSESPPLFFPIHCDCYVNDGFSNWVIEELVLWD